MFSVRSLYRFLSYGGISSLKLIRLWDSRIPLRVKIFLWLAFQNRIQIADQLKQRGWPGDVNCNLCGIREDTDHVLFNCVLAKFIWSCIREILLWDRVPVSLDDLHMNWLGKRGANYYHVDLFSFAAIAWTLWTVRNKGAMERVFPKQPSAVFFQLMSCLQRWQILLKDHDRRKLDQFLEKARVWMQNFKNRI